jgi:hypothetical protein
LLSENGFHEHLETKKYTFGAPKFSSQAELERSDKLILDYVNEILKDDAHIKSRIPLSYQHGEFAEAVFDAIIIW